MTTCEPSGLFQRFRPTGPCDLNADSKGIWQQRRAQPNGNCAVLRGEYQPLVCLNTIYIQINSRSITCPILDYHAQLTQEELGRVPNARTISIAHRTVVHKNTRRPADPALVDASIMISTPDTLDTVDNR